MLNFTVCNPAVSLEWQFWTDAGGTHIETIGRSGYNICWTQCHWSKSANTDSFPMRNRDVVSIKSADNLTQPLNEYNLVVHATQCAYNSRYFLLSRGMCLKNAFLPRYFFHRQNCVTFIYFKVSLEGKWQHNALPGQYGLTLQSPCRGVLNSPGEVFSKPKVEHRAYKCGWILNIRRAQRLLFQGWPEIGSFVPFY